VQAWAAFAAVGEPALGDKAARLARLVAALLTTRRCLFI
jgi:hypothetical protein